MLRRMSVTCYQRGPALNGGFLTFPLSSVWETPWRLHSGPPRCRVCPMVMLAASAERRVFFCGCFVFALFCVFARLVGIITQSQRRTTCQHNQVGGIELCQRQTQQTAWGETGGNTDNSSVQFVLVQSLIFFFFLISIKLFLNAGKIVFQGTFREVKMRFSFYFLFAFAKYYQFL